MQFKKYYASYDEHSVVQEQVASELVRFLPEKQLVDKVLEIGCGTGIFTRKYLEKLQVNKLILNDIYDSREYLQDINFQDFICANIELVKIPQVDVVLSSSVFQWIDNLEALFAKIAESTEELVFSIYIEGNLAEIKQHFGVSLNYHTTMALTQMLSEYFSVVNSIERTYELDFLSPLDALRHLKYTGVTGFGDPSQCMRKVKSFTSTKLTYRAALFQCQK